MVSICEQRGLCGCRTVGAAKVFHLQEALFAAYNSNWGLCSEALAKAIKLIGEQFHFRSRDDWCRASAVLLHLNFGEELMAFLRERGDDSRLRPWYEALSTQH
jgi:hypothetical protein